MPGVGPESHRAQRIGHASATHAGPQSHAPGSGAAQLRLHQHRQVFDVANQGDYFVYVALFMEGGGMFQPVVDIDYVGSTAAAVTVGGAGVDVGPIDLALYAAP